MKSQIAPQPSTPPISSGSIWQQMTSDPLPTMKCKSKLAQEVYESILWRIDAKCQANETMAIGVIGCRGKSGSTTIAANLALHASDQHSGRVLLIDANWPNAVRSKPNRQRPGLQNMFDLPHEAGLYDILSGDLSPRECQPQQVSENLDLLCRGKWGEDQPAHVRQEFVEEMLSEYKMDYRLIFVDLPTAEDLRSALPVARQLDGSLLVTRFEAIKQPQALRALRRLQEDGVDIWGSILNRHREYVPKWLRNWFL